MIIYENTYNCESLYYWERDMEEAISPNYNNKAPKEDEFRGTIKVTIEYEEEE